MRSPRSTFSCQFWEEAPPASPCLSVLMTWQTNCAELRIISILNPQQHINLGCKRVLSFSPDPSGYWLPQSCSSRLYSARISHRLIARHSSKQLPSKPCPDATGHWFLTQPYCRSLSRAIFSYGYATETVSVSYCCYQLDSEHYHQLEPVITLSSSYDVMVLHCWEWKHTISTSLNK